MLPLWGEYPYIQEHHHHHRLPPRRNINKIIKKTPWGTLVEIAARTNSDQRDLKKRSGSLELRNTIKIHQNISRRIFGRFHRGHYRKLKENITEDRTCRNGSKWRTDVIEKVWECEFTHFKIRSWSIRNVDIVSTNR